MKDEIGSTEWRSDQASRQAELNGCLLSFCAKEVTSLNELAEIARRLNDVYSDEGFRHRYSDILDVIYDIDCNSSGVNGVGEEAQYVIARSNGLAQGLRMLYTHKCDDRCGGEASCQIHKLQKDSRLGKLYDHANLEARRIGYETGPTFRTIDYVTQLERKLGDARIEIDEAEKKARDAINEAKDLRKEVVSILGVFSAIVLAFNASITFTTSSVSAVDTTPPFNVAFVVTIIGFVLFNCLYGAFAFIYRIIRPGKDPDQIIGTKRIAGIELTAVSCALLLGTLAYTYGMACWPEVTHWAILLSLAVLAVGIALICRS